MVVCVMAKTFFPQCIFSLQDKSKENLRKCEFGKNWAAMFPAHRKAGVYARRTTAISKPGKPGRSCRRKVRRDEGIPPYVCPEGRGRPVWPDACRGS